MMLDTAVRLSAPPREWGGRMPETGGTYYDRQEVRDPEERESSIFNALPGLIRHALDNAPYFAETLAGIEPDNVASRADLARLPIIRKSDLSELQSRQRPFGRITATRSPAWHASSPRRGRSMIRRARGRITGAWRARCMPPVSARATSCTTRSRII